MIIEMCMTSGNSVLYYRSRDGVSIVQEVVDGSTGEVMRHRGRPMIQTGVTLRDIKFMVALVCDTRLSDEDIVETLMETGDDLHFDEVNGMQGEYISRTAHLMEKEA